MDIGSSSMHYREAISICLAAMLLKASGASQSRSAPTTRALLPFIKGGWEGFRRAGHSPQSPFSKGGILTQVDGSCVSCLWTNETIA